MHDENSKQNAAFIWEVCLLRRLHQMGLIDKAALEGICRIAAEDYGATLPVNLCLDC